MAPTEISHADLKLMTRAASLRFNALEGHLRRNESEGASNEDHPAPCQLSARGPAESRLDVGIAGYEQNVRLGAGANIEVGASCVPFEIYKVR